MSRNTRLTTLWLIFLANKEGKTNVFRHIPAFASQILDRNASAISLSQFHCASLQRFLNYEDAIILHSCFEKVQPQPRSCGEGLSRETVDASIAYMFTGQIPEHLKAAFTTSGLIDLSNAVTKTQEKVRLVTTMPGFSKVNLVQAFFHSSVSWLQHV